VGDSAVKVEEKL